MSTPKSLEYFKAFEQGFVNVDKDWDGMKSVFASDAVVKYAFAGFPTIEGDEETANAGFKATLKRFRPKFTYIAGTDTDCMYSVVAYFETIKGDGAVYTAHTYLEFNDEGKVVKKVSYSTDSHALATLIQAAMEE